MGVILHILVFIGMFLLFTVLIQAFNHFAERNSNKKEKR
jgi:hypothetical protein